VLEVAVGGLHMTGCVVKGVVFFLLSTTIIGDGVMAGPPS
jgi:hypothetical protein